MRRREFFTRPQTFRLFVCLFGKALVEETQHEIDQLGDTHDDEDGILKSLLRNASPFLFPCTIEFSLICAVILFEMWKRVDEKIDAKSETPTRSSYHLSIDCSSSHRSAPGNLIKSIGFPVNLLMRYRRDFKTFPSPSFPSFSFFFQRSLRRNFDHRRNDIELDHVLHAEGHQNEDRDCSSHGVGRHYTRVR